MQTSTQKLTRSKNSAILGGVCAGLARYFGMDVTMVRLLYIIISVLSAAFPGTLVYIILWIVMPAED